MTASPSLSSIMLDRKNHPVTETNLIFSRNFIRILSKSL